MSKSNAEIMQLVQKYQQDLNNVAAEIEQQRKEDTKKLVQESHEKMAKERDAINHRIAQLDMQIQDQFNLVFGS